jgi:carboxyl-terminal processing protease
LNFSSKKQIMKSLKKTAIAIVFLLSEISLYSQNYNASKKFEQLIQLIKYSYVDSVSEDKMVENAIVGMLKELDPHSVYIPKEELQRMNEPLEGNFEGVGIQFQIIKDTIVVISPIVGGPSEKLGIRAGDKIITVEGEKIAGVGIKNNDVSKKLRGNKGTKVNVGIKRNGNKELIDFTITRDKIPIYSVDASYMVTPEIGYIKISRFAKETVKEYEEALNKLKAQGMQSLVLDLMGNGGGYLNTAIELADEFLSKGKLLVYTEGVRQTKQEYKSTNRGNFESGKLVVLIDEGSASASEIVSGAIQDWDRGLIVGRRSFGKGLVQKPYPLSDGSAVRLTTARYYTPSGRCIQKPYDEGADEYQKEINERFKNGEIVDPSKIKLHDSLKYYTSTKRIVYGAGGIMPDIYTAFDTTISTKYFQRIARKGIIGDFTLNYLDQHRNELLLKYPNFEIFNKTFNTEEEIYNDLINTAEKADLNRDEIDTEKEKSDFILKLNLKASFARHLFDVSAYYQVINEVNEAYKKAVEVIQDDTFKKLKLSYK